MCQSQGLCSSRSDSTVSPQDETGSSQQLIEPVNIDSGTVSAGDYHLLPDVVDEPPYMFGGGGPILYCLTLRVA